MTRSVFFYPRSIHSVIIVKLVYIIVGVGQHFSSNIIWTNLSNQRETQLFFQDKHQVSLLQQHDTDVSKYDKMWVNTNKLNLQFFLLFRSIFPNKNVNLGSKNFFEKMDIYTLEDLKWDDFWVIKMFLWCIMVLFYKQNHIWISKYYRFIVLGMLFRRVFKVFRQALFRKTTQKSSHFNSSKV